MKIFKTRRYLLLSSVACVSLLSAGRAFAFDYQFDNGVDVRFDNTIQYEVIERTAPESPYIASEANSNDGDNNLRAGIVSNRVDLLSKFDISDNGYGFDVTVDSFYDAVYNQKTQNTSGATYNPATTPYTKFTSATQTQAGRNIELRNLFVYGSNTIAGIPVTLRVGRLVNLYGESLFFATNGISYGMGPIDFERGASVPGTQAKDLFLPTGQILLSAQLSETISASAYYKLEWTPYNFVASGSYFSPGDPPGPGSQRIIGPIIGGKQAYFYRAQDIHGSNSGQFGAAVHYNPNGTTWDFGLYALQYNDANPQIYTHTVIGAHGPVLTLQPSAVGSPTAYSFGTYQDVFADHIQIYGVSSSVTEGPVNLAGEISIRANEDLNSAVSVAPGVQANNTNHPLYAIGRTLHYQVSEIYAGPKTSLWDASSVAGEVAGVNLLSIDKNSENFSRATSKHMAFGLRTVVSATYYEVYPGLDLTPHVILGYNFMGEAPDTPGFNGTGIDRGGDLTLGSSATYLAVWTGSINYTRYIAPAHRDPYADRDFVSFNVGRTF